MSCRELDPSEFESELQKYPKVRDADYHELQCIVGGVGGDEKPSPTTTSTSTSKRQEQQQPQQQQQQQQNEQQQQQSLSFWDQLSLLLKDVGGLNDQQRAAIDNHLRQHVRHLVSTCSLDDLNRLAAAVE
eukprot:TRINITY_DN12808_c0_g1_i1.p1 TRINITY_DN12808_c0_g1~~TRINITY_DN12808_c0_g1_i1.p1  ORF type:complete len:130 (+),score=53.75 TRINITY_DN12808_c0_g1_i1:79-468(+)